MADLTAAIREMLKKGMSEAQVVDSLRELGVSNPEQTFRSATEALKPMTVPSPPASREEPKLEFVSMTPGGEKSSIEDKIPELQSMPRTTLSTIGEAGEKLDEAIALLKALAEINKKILETNRDILLRLK